MDYTTYKPNQVFCAYPVHGEQKGSRVYAVHETPGSIDMKGTA